MDFQLVMDGKMLLGLAPTMLNSFPGYITSHWGGYILSSKKIPKFGCGRVLKVGYGQPQLFPFYYQSEKMRWAYFGVVILGMYYLFGEPDPGWKILE